MIEYVYVIVRTDIPLEQQIVQACHGALEAGFSSEKPHASPHLVVCEVRDETELLDAAGYLERSGISFELFHEPWRATKSLCAYSLGNPVPV